MSTIFYTDDDADDVHVFSQALKEVDKSVALQVSECGNELIKSLHNPPPTPSLIFLDLNMPGKDGRQTLKEIKTNERFKDYPVIIFSTSSNPDDIDYTYKHGANLYVRKPSKYTELKNLIQACIKIDWANYSRPSKEDFYLKAS